MLNQIKHEIHNIISGKSKVRFGTLIQTITSYLDDGKTSGGTIEESKRFKEQETKRLEEFVSKYNLWKNDIDFSQYVSEGAEQKVYLNDSDHVLKLNDAIYYDSWKTYFYSLLLHNFFFSDTAYEVIGFTKQDDVLFCVVQQPFVSITESTNLDTVKEFMKGNGFELIRNNDYRNIDLGIILEDLHDENVLTKNGILYFIDTVFYLTDEFWSE